MAEYARENPILAFFCVIVASMAAIDMTRLACNAFVMAVALVFG